ncbi:hypothetical protein ANN_12738 [Periplaneta americana]|uniref:Uncharacterized protein n=1 Tax=Periplaneta americana TaxID=6978 RepID=A0ABQ8TI04_PERAM|nr:hypothetical protein ANN_12738 [Periplaneta americana]
MMTSLMLHRCPTVPSACRGGDCIHQPPTRSVNVEDSWAGRFWARTGCNFGGSGYGRCVTGDCGNKLHCNETEVMSLATVAEITLAGFGGKDYYDVSFLSGFNVPVQMKPSSGREHQLFRCGTAGCKKNLNPACPKNLQVRKGNEIVACRDACSVSKEDKDCCRGRFSNEEECQSKLVNARQIHLQNNLGYTVWIGILAHQGKQTLDNGGFTLYAGGRRNVNMPDNWGGYFWARTGCNFDDSGHGRCATGDCGGKLHCTAGHMPPASLAEFNFELIKGLDIYCVSLINGFNVAIQIKPSNGRGYQRRCGTAGCVNNLNPSCPNNLQVRKGNEIVACDNACYALNTDTDCCQGDLSPVEKCQSSDTTEHFKRNCPNACTYASDDTSCNFICENTDYDIIFG